MVIEPGPLALIYSSPLPSCYWSGVVDHEVVKVIILKKSLADWHITYALGSNHNFPPSTGRFRPYVVPSIFPFPFTGTSISLSSACNSPASSQSSLGRSRLALFNLIYLN